MCENSFVYRENYVIYELTGQTTVFREKKKNSNNIEEMIVDVFEQ